MDKKNEIITLIHDITDIQDKKLEVIKNQNYVEAARLRVMERTLIDKLDELSGVNDFFKKVYSTEKVLKHLEILIHSTEELKKLRPNFNEVFGDINFDKYLITLYQQRDEAYQAVLQIKEIKK